MKLSDLVSKVPLVGPSYLTKLSKLNISTINDLLHHYPNRHEDLTLTTVKAEVVSAKNTYTRFGKTIQRVVVKTDDQMRELTWFNQPWIVKTLTPKTLLSIAGGDTSPEYEIVKDGSSLIHTGRLVPIYPETAGVSSKWLRSRLNLMLNLPLEIKDFLPQKIRQEEKLIDLKTALKQIHFPDNQGELEEARKRLSFDELFWLQLKQLYNRKTWQQKSLSRKFVVNQEKILNLITKLPFELTPSQKRSIKEILTDLSKGTPMNRLLSGDVGSGKTVVAAVALYVAVDNGLQGILMAPTQILATQHFNTLRSVFEGSGVKIELITAAEKKASLTADILVGTQALLHRKLSGEKLSLVVIDEQHRFGVKQRGELLNYGKISPHLLTMTATPIPRTAALTIYGDLDLSVLDEMPKGRLAPKTYLVPKVKQLDAWHWIDQQIVEEKAQAFIVYPLIDPSGSETLSDVKAATTEFNQIKSVFSDREVDLIHGRMKAKDKEAVIERFRDGKSEILVATPVIEVGIDIPSASIMVIENAERFGLAQLHQLRGRVGRRGQQAYCLLFCKNEKASPRLKYLTKINNGQKLAEIDLKLRGPGEIYGVSQHGYWELKLTDLSDLSLIKKTKKAAKKTLAKPDPVLLEVLKQSKIEEIKAN